MQNPIKQISIGAVLGWVALAVVAFAILDLSGLTNWILYPVSTARATFSKTK